MIHALCRKWYHPIQMKDGQRFNFEQITRLLQIKYVFKHKKKSATLMSNGL